MSPPAEPDEARDRLRHELLTPLTVIRGRAFLLARAVRRSPTLADAERERLLAGLAAIDAAVDALVAAADAIGAADAGRTRDADARPPRPAADPARCDAG